VCEEMREKSFESCESTEFERKLNKHLNHESYLWSKVSLFLEKKTSSAQIQSTKNFLAFFQNLLQIPHCQTIMEQDSLERATEQLQDMECDDALSTSADAGSQEEERDNVGEMPVRNNFCFNTPNDSFCFQADLWTKIRDQQTSEPSMFVSGWEGDEERGLVPGNAADPSEQFLTAAENGDLETLREMHEQNPTLLMVSFWRGRILNLFPMIFRQETETNTLLFIELPTIITRTFADGCCQ